MCFPIYNNVYPKYCQSYKKDVCQWNQRLYLWKVLLKKMDFQRKTVAIQGNAWKKTIVVVCKQINWKNTWPSNAKEHYQSFIRKTQNQ